MSPLRLAAVALSCALSCVAVPVVAPAAAAAEPEQVLARMSLRQQVGQVFMVGTTAAAVDRRTRDQISRFHVGNVFLSGRSYEGTAAPRHVVRTMRAQVDGSSTAGVGLLVATDQEGGFVQVLQGSGFSAMPSALAQGRWRAAKLQRRAQTWGGQLADVGVDVNLAPVLDTVPGAKAAEHNPPIGFYYREYGYTPARVASRGVAFLDGMAAAGVAGAVKHFPGLGRVHANTDTASGVTDRVTRRHDPYLRPFRAAVAAGAPMVMMSSARYTRLDPRQPAAFSPYVVRRILRGDLGFDGVVISDDLGNAKQVAAVPAGRRATRFLGAGGDLVLTVSAARLPAMYRAVLARARQVPAFRVRLEAAVLRILELKEQQGRL